MNNQRNEMSVAPSALGRGFRTVRHHAIGPASPEAFDEVFASLARRESAHAQTSSAMVRSIDPTQFRDLAAEMDRQHERLTQLLRDIDGDTASE
jgi:hypothetical protein